MITNGNLISMVNGHPALDGQRIPVSMVLEALAAGALIDEVCLDYNLTVEHVLACLEFAAREIAHSPYVMTSLMMGNMQHTFPLQGFDAGLGSFDLEVTWLCRNIG